jgi:hypothetical protein
VKCRELLDGVRDCQRRKECVQWSWLFVWLMCRNWGEENLQERGEIRANWNLGEEKLLDIVNRFVA